MRWRDGWTVGLVALLAQACGLPRDADGTLERVTGGTMRVGFAVDSPWVTDSGGQPGGVEAALVRGLARELGARVAWVPGGEATLLETLHERELDLVIAGLTDASPWGKDVGLTAPYFTDTALVAKNPEKHGGGEGVTPREGKHVLAAPPGENAWLVRVERMLKAREPEVPRLLRRAAP